MPTLKTKLVHQKEALADAISNISPEMTPFRNEIGKTKISASYTEFMTDTLATANKDNARLEGADALDATLTSPVRLGNHTQVFAKEVKVSNSLIATDHAGTKDEYARQITKAGRELNRDIEAALVSANASRGESGANPRKLGGAAAWISTNANHGTGGSTPGYANAVVAAPVAGTARPLTKAMFDDMAQKVWANGGDPTMIICSGPLKQKVSSFATGNGAWNQDAAKKTIYAGVDVYVSDFGRHTIVPHLFMPAQTVISFDPSLWAVATMRSVEKIELASTGDAANKMLVTELTLHSYNEAGNGKIADVTV